MQSATVRAVQKMKQPGERPDQAAAGGRQGWAWECSSPWLGKVLVRKNDSGPPSGPCRESHI